MKQIHIVMHKYCDGYATEIDSIYNVFEDYTDALFRASDLNAACDDEYISYFVATYDVIQCGC